MLVGLIIIGAIILFSLWAMCKAASDADATREWNENWVGQKFEKKCKEDVNQSKK